MSYVNDAIESIKSSSPSLAFLRNRHLEMALFELKENHPVFTGQREIYFQIEQFSKINDLKLTPFEEFLREREGTMNLVEILKEFDKIDNGTYASIYKFLTV